MQTSGSLVIKKVSLKLLVFPFYHEYDISSFAIFHTLCSWLCVNSKLQGRQ